MAKRKNRKLSGSAPSETAKESVVVGNRLNVTDGDGKRRISLFIEDDKAMLAFYDKQEMARFLIAETPDGSAVMSALEPNVEKDVYEDTFRLVVSSGEPELVMRDAIFKNVSVMSPKGFFTSDEAD